LTKRDLAERIGSLNSGSEIEWGTLFLERMLSGIASATDFVLLWSRAAACSRWSWGELDLAGLRCNDNIFLGG
jgi:hypothetical protein